MGRRAQGFRVQWKRGWAYVRFTHASDDHRIALGTRDPGEAQERAAAEYAAALSGRRRPIVVTGRARRPLLALDELLAEWIADCAGVLDETTCATLETYARHFVAFFGSLERLTSPSIGDYGRARLRAVLRKTVQKELSFLNAFLAWLVERGVLAEAPAIPDLPRKATGVRAGPQRAVPVEIDEAQARAIIAALPEQSKSIGGRTWPIRARFLVAWETGLRPATIASLSVPEHFRPGALTLRVDDADDKARFGRELPLSHAAREALLAVAPRGGLIFGSHRFDKVLKAAAETVLGPELAKRFAAYDFRHGRGTHLADEGAPLTGIAYLLGHRRLTTTDRYMKGSRRAAERALAAVGAPFPPPGAPTSPAGTAKSRESLGDRRGLNPRHLEPQRSEDHDSSENPGVLAVRTGPNEAQSVPVSAPGALFAERALRALAMAFLDEGEAWVRAVRQAFDGDEAGTLATLHAIAELRGGR